MFVMDLPTYEFGTVHFKLKGLTVEKYKNSISYTVISPYKYKDYNLPRELITMSLTKFELASVEFGVKDLSLWFQQVEG
jgi:hypothetical protein